MKIGIFSILPDVVADPAVVARHAEELGFSSYWVPDHIILPSTYDTEYPGKGLEDKEPDYLWQMPDPMIALMRAASATSTLEIGTAVLLAGERHPLHLAKEVASLDSFSEGRFHFGIGAGWCREEAEILGVDFDHRWGQIKEAVKIMQSCWTDPETEFRGKYYDFPAVRCYPKPHQKPHPPVYLPSIIVGGEWSQRVFKRIVEWGDGWLPVVADIDQIAIGMRQMRDLANESGRSDKKILVNVLGGNGQWRTRKEIDSFVDLEVDQVTLWLQSRDVDGIRKEMDKLAADLLA